MVTVATNSTHADVGAQFGAAISSNGPTFLILFFAFAVLRKWFPRTYACRTLDPNVCVQNERACWFAWTRAVRVVLPFTVRPRVFAAATDLIFHPCNSHGLRSGSP